MDRAVIIARLGGTAAFFLNEQGYFEGQPLPFCSVETAWDTMVERGYRVVVSDEIFDNGIYRMASWHGANGAGAGRRLERVITVEQRIEMHDRGENALLAAFDAPFLST